jgi:hypothetical protein
MSIGRCLRDSTVELSLERTGKRPLLLVPKPILSKGVDSRFHATRSESWSYWHIGVSDLEMGRVLPLSQRNRFEGVSISGQYLLFHVEQ